MNVVPRLSLRLAKWLTLSMLWRTLLSWSISRGVAIRLRLTVMSMQRVMRTLPRLRQHFPVIILDWTLGLFFHPTASKTLGMFWQCWIIVYLYQGWYHHRHLVLHLHPQCYLHLVRSCPGLLVSKESASGASHHFLLSQPMLTVNVNHLVFQVLPLLWDKV